MSANNTSKTITYFAQLLSITLLLFYGLALMFGPMVLSFIFACFFSFLFNKKTFKFSLQEKLPVVTLIVIALIIFTRIFIDSIEAWDPRTVWLFHSKIIYLANGINQHTGWQHSSLFYTHPDYPLLYSLIGALLSNLDSQWNENLAKLSSVFLIAPGIAWLCGFIKKNKLSILLVFFIFTSLRNFLWGGYLDGYLAIYSACAVLLYSRYEKTGDESDLISALAAAGLLLSIKNEGALIFIALFLSYYTIKNFHRLTLQKVSKKLFFIFFIATLPFILWSLLKKRWGITSEFKFLELSTLERIYTRMIDGHSLRQIVESMFFFERTTFKVIVVFCASLILKQVTSRTKHLSFLFYFAFYTAFFYALGLFVVYLATPYDLMWHLVASVERTLLTFIVLMVVSIFSLLYTIEND